jgi:hypothetical protein
MNQYGNTEPFPDDKPLEDDDAQGDAPARKHRVLFYTLEQKEK